ncbi:response regulator, partial [bacterium]|nr:response regulator [bacterium]
MAKLVIVEADPTLANNLENALKDNFDINIALNGKDGLDTIVENKPDVAVLDFFLPELNGFQICTQLKQQGLLDNINVVLLVDSEDIGNRFVNQFGVKKYFLKPYNVDDIASFAIEMVSEEDISVADDGEDDDFPSFDDESLKLLDDIFADMETDGQPAEEPEEELPMLEEETSIDEKTEILSGPDEEKSEDQAVVEAAPVTPDEVPPAAETSMDDELNVNAILGDLDDTLNSLDIDDDGSAGLGIDSGIPDIDEEDSLPTADDETIVADAMQADDAVPDIPEIDEAGPEIPDLDEIPEEQPQVEIPDLEDDIPQEPEAPVEEIPEIPDLDEAAATEEPELEIPDIEEAPAEEPVVEEIPTEEPPAEVPVEAAVEETVEEITADDLNLDIPDIEEAPAEEPVVEEIPTEEPPAEVPIEAAVEETVEEITADDLNLDIPDIEDGAPAEEPVVEEIPAEEPPAEAPVEAAVEETVEEITAD